MVSLGSLFTWQCLAAEGLRLPSVRARFPLLLTYSFLALAKLAFRLMKKTKQTKQKQKQKEEEEIEEEDTICEDVPTV
jgi:hypothetical protein